MKFSILLALLLLSSCSQQKWCAYTDDGVEECHSVQEWADINAEKVVKKACLDHEVEVRHILTENDPNYLTSRTKCGYRK